MLVAKVSQNGSPYNVATLHYLPPDARNFHRTLMERVVSFHGLGTYTLSRTQYLREKRGFKLICQVRVMPEAVTVLRYDPQHPTFEPWTGRKMFWEKEAVAERFIHAPKWQTMKSVRSTLAKVKGHVPRQKARKHGWSQVLGVLLRKV